MMSRNWRRSTALAGFFSLAAFGAADAASTCESLSNLKLDNATIDAAQSQPAGAYTPAGGKELADLPAFCRAHGIATPVEGSKIGFEVWAPASGWNGKLEMLGNGGYSSSLDYSAMAAALKRGYAAVATDTGHAGDDPDFAVGHPQSIADWGHRAVHETSIQSKAVVSAFYGQAARHAYFWGCSTGGHQALMEAQRYPRDFDGIIAGDPGNNRTHLNAGFFWQFVKNHRMSDLSVIVPPGKLHLITDAVVKACRGKDGGSPTDDFLTDPNSCEFSPATLLCKGVDGPDCLTQEQVNAMAAMYGGARDPKTGEQIFFGWPKGSEDSGRVVKDLPGWSLYWADPAHQDRPARVNFWKIWAFGNPDWDWRSFDFDSDMKLADDRLASTINAMSPDLSAFRAAGGKLIQYHGLADPVVPPNESIEYFDRVQASLDKAKPDDASTDFYRLFLVPGMYHCGGGPGPNVLDVQAALENWVEQDHAPETIAATKFRNDRAADGVAMSRPLCVYPKSARYDGSGDPTSATSFACVDVPRAPVIAPADAYLR